MFRSEKKIKKSNSYYVSFFESSPYSLQDWEKSISGLCKHFNHMIFNGLKKSKINLAFKGLVFFKILIRSFGFTLFNTSPSALILRHLIPLKDQNFKSQLLCFHWTALILRPLIPLKNQNFKLQLLCFHWTVFYQLKPFIIWWNTRGINQLSMRVYFLKDRHFASAMCREDTDLHNYTFNREIQRVKQRESEGNLRT